MDRSCITISIQGGHTDVATGLRDHEYRATNNEFVGGPGFGSSTIINPEEHRVSNDSEVPQIKSSTQLSNEAYSRDHPEFNNDARNREYDRQTLAQFNHRADSRPPASFNSKIVHKVDNLSVQESEPSSKLTNNMHLTRQSDFITGFHAQEDRGANDGIARQPDSRTSAEVNSEEQYRAQNPLPLRNQPIFDDNYHKNLQDHVHTSTTTSAGHQDDTRAHQGCYKRTTH